MLRQLAFASFILLAPTLASAETAKFPIEEATIEDIQAAILRGELTSTRVVQLYLSRIKAYNGTCVEQPDGALGAGPIKPIKNAHQLNALMTLNLRPSTREKLGFDNRKARSMTDPVDEFVDLDRIGEAGRKARALRMVSRMGRGVAVRT